MNISEIKNYGTKYTKQLKTVNSETSKGMLLGKTAKGKDNCSVPSRLIYTHKRAGEKKEKNKKKRKRKKAKHLSLLPKSRMITLAYFLKW